MHEADEVVFELRLVLEEFSADVTSRLAEVRGMASPHVGDEAALRHPLVAVLAAHLASILAVPMQTVVLQGVLARHSLLT